AASARCGWVCGSWPSVRGLNRVEPRLDPVDVLARERVRPLVDLGGRAGAVDMADGVRLAEVETAVADRERVAVERSHRRPGDAVALGVVLAAVARAAEAGGLRRDQRDVAELLLLVVEERPVGPHRAAEVGAVVRDDREARLALEQAVV